MSRVNPYNLLPAFEVATAVYCCRSSRFFGTVGCYLQPEALANPAVKLVVEAAKGYARDAGHGPTHDTIVLQYLCTLRAKGRVNQEQIDGVVALLDGSDDAGLPPEEDVIACLTPVLKDRIRGDAVRDAVKAYGEGGDLDRTMKMLREAERVGRVDTSIGTTLSGAGKVVASIRHLERLSTGIPDLDRELMNGPPRGTENIVNGRGKSGKSMFLNTVAANSLLIGKSVLYATLELPVPWQLARLYAALTGIPTHAVLDGKMEEAERAVAALGLAPNQFAIQEFPAGVATVEDIFAWIDGWVETSGAEPEVVIIDYGDKIRAEASRETSSSKAIGLVFEKMRLRAHDRGWWLWTASQAKRGKKQGGKKGRNEDDLVDGEDVADSIDKLRVADLVVSLTRRDDGLMYKSTYRYGEASAVIGPLPHDWDHGRMVRELMAHEQRRLNGEACEPIPF